MDRTAFYNAIRPMFAGGLSQRQVEGIDAVLDSCERNGVDDPHHVSNILSNVRRETGGYMSPIKETVMRHHADKNPSDATVIARLDRAFAKGLLKWVKTPYWRDGAFGRGQIQITHWAMYDKLGKRLGIPLRQKPQLALVLKHSADITVVGMSEGLFTGKRLSDYKFPAALTAAPKSHPRRIVNGQDGSDKEVAADHREFYDALMAAGFGKVAAKPAVVKPAAPGPTPPAAPAKPASFWRAIFEVVLAIFRRKV